MITYEHLLNHLNRVRICEIKSNAKPNEIEIKKLESENIHHPIVQSYYVWRRSCLLVSSPILCISMFLGIIDLGKELSDPAVRDGLNGLGKILVLLSGVDTTILFAAIVYAIVNWENMKKSMYAVRIGWLISFIMPLLPALFPMQMIFKARLVDQLDDATIYMFKLSFALSYALTLLPVTVTFPGGAVRASIRIRWLLPDSFIAGWILVMCAPFYSIVVCIALVVVMQIVGNGVLFVGILLIVLAPCIYVVRANHFTSDWSKEEKLNQVRATQKVIAVVSLCGYALFLLWAFTADENGMKPIGSKTSEFDTTTYLLSYSQGFRMILEVFARTIVTTILFSDAILRVTLRNRSNEHQQRIENGNVMNEDFQAFLDNFPLSTDDDSNTTKSDSTSEKVKIDETEKYDIERQSSTKDAALPYDDKVLTLEVENILYEYGDGEKNSIDKKCVAEILAREKESEV
jgi:hypothetical protein